MPLATFANATGKHCPPVLALTPHYIEVMELEHRRTSAMLVTKIYDVHFAGLLEMMAVTYNSPDTLWTKRSNLR